MENRLKTSIAIFVFIFLVAGIKSQESVKFSSEKVQMAWLKAFNDSEDLDPFYTENSGILHNDVLSVGVDKIQQALMDFKKNAGHLNNYESKESMQLYDNQKFELGSYHAKSGAAFHSIIGWRKGDQWTKEFEVIYKKEVYPNSGMTDVDKERINWEKYSNLHRPDLIAEQVFLKDGRYFHRGKEYIGIEIAEAYSYMNNENYKIKLKALNVLQVSKDIIFDIGTYDTGGKGLYVLIWKRVKDGWKLFLDFNF